MKAKEFINLLQVKIESLPSKDKNDIIFYYDELIMGAIDGGLNEEEAVNNLGSIDDIASKLLAEFKSYEKSSNHNLEFPDALFKKSKSFDSRFQNINIDCLNGNIIIKLNDEDKISVRHYNSLKHKIEVYENADSIFIKRKSRKNVLGYIIYNIISALFALCVCWLFEFKFKALTIALVSIAFNLPFIFFILYSVSTGYNNIYLNLPDNKYYNLNLNSKNGNLKMYDIDFHNFYGISKNGSVKIKNCSFNIANFKTSNGSLKCFTEYIENSKIIKEAKFLSYNGAVKISNMEFNTINTKNKNGNFKLVNGVINNIIEAECINGNLKFKNSKVNGTKLKTKNGNIVFKNGEVNNLSTVETHAGVIKFKDSNLGDVDLKSNQGSIKVKRSKIKDVVSTTNAGNVKLIKINAPRLRYKLNLTSRFGSCKVKELFLTNNTHTDNIVPESNKIEAYTNAGSIKISFLN